MARGGYVDDRHEFWDPENDFLVKNSHLPRGTNFLCSKRSRPTVSMNRGVRFQKMNRIELGCAY